MSDTSLAQLVADGVLGMGDGYRTRSDQLEATGLPILRVAEVQDGQARPSDGDHVGFGWRAKMGPKTTKPGDVVITTKGSVGRIARINADFPEHVYSPQLCFLRVIDASRLDPLWLYYWARSVSFRRQLERYSGQTDMAPYLSLGDLRRFRVSPPSLEVQSDVAGRMAVLDRAADHSERLGRQLGAHLLTSWRAACAESGLHKQVKDLADVKKGLSYKGQFLSESGTPMINLANFGRDGSFQASGTKYYTGPIKAERVLSKGALVIANTDLTQTRDIIGRPVLAPQSDVTSSHHTYQVDAAPSAALGLFAALQEPRIRQRFVQTATGTTVSALPRDVLLSTEVPWLAEAALDTWASGAWPLVHAAWELSGEAERLRLMRDELLPHLVNTAAQDPAP